MESFPLHVIIFRRDHVMRFNKKRIQTILSKSITVPMCDVSHVILIYKRFLLSHDKSRLGRDKFGPYEKLSSI